MKSPFLLVFLLCSAMSPCCSALAQSNAPGKSLSPRPALVQDQESGGRSVPHLAQPKLYPGLSLDITVFVAGKKEIEERQKRISDTGELSLPLVDLIVVQGMTIRELAAHLTGLYGQFFVSPQVLVEFTADIRSDGVSPWGYVVVLGQVKNPGRVAIPPTRDLSVTAAIQAAGGLDTSAKSSAIRITRTQREGGTKQMEMDLRKIGIQGNLSEDVALQAGDVIFVPEMIF